MEYNLQNHTIRASHLELEVDYFGHVTCEEDWGLKEQPTFHRVYYIHDGKAWCYLDGQKVRLEPGHLYMMPVHKAYELFQDPEYPLECSFIHVQIFPVVTSGMLSIRPEEDSLLERGLLLMKDIIDSGHQEAGRLQAKAVIGLMADLMSFDYMTDPLIIESLKMMHSSYGDYLTNEVIAGKLGYNANYYIKRFKEVMGMTPGTYLTSYRLRVAMRSLVAGISVKEVASEVGYNDAKAFSRWFRKKTGVPPSDYVTYYILHP